MANRQFIQSFFSFFRAPVMLAGKINLHTDASVLSTSKIKGASIAKTSTGVYTITLQDKYNTLISANVTPMFAATVADLAVEVVSADVSSAKTIVLRTKTISTGAAVDVSAATTLYVNLMLGNSTLDA